MKSGIVDRTEVYRAVARCWGLKNLNFSKSSLKHHHLTHKSSKSHGAGGFEQLLPILSSAEYLEAEERQARPRQECSIEDDAVIDIPGLHVLWLKMVLRQEQQRLRDAMSEYGIGVLTDEGWAVADEMRHTKLAEGDGAARTTHVYAYAFQRRVTRAVKAAKDEAVSKGLDYREHIDPIGARLSEKQLRSLEEPKRSAGH